MIYKIILERIGEITLLPDSQKLFGFLMSKLSEHFTANEVSSFVNGVYENKTKCMISNLLPEGYLPFPKSYLLDNISGNSKGIYKLIKKIDYIDERSLVNIIKYFNFHDETTHNTGTLKSIEELEKEIDSEISFISIKQRYSQKFKLESQEKAMPGLPNKSYSLPILEYCLNGKGELFSFFVEVEKNSILASYIEELCKNPNNHETIYGLGSKVSHGYNTYQLKCVEKYKKDENNERKHILINMGMLIPQIENIDKEGSFLEIYSSNRKSYEISDNIEKVISFIAPGSVISTNNKNRNVGRCIANEYNIVHKNAIIFGNSFIKRLEVD